jgi:Tfp pilus assembly protein PilF
MDKNSRNIMADTFDQGLLATTEKPHDETLGQFHTIPIHRPEDYTACKRIGIRLQALEQYASAEAYYRRAMAFCPDDAELQANLGTTLMYQGRLDDACQYLTYATAIAPHEADIWYNLGNAYSVAGNITKAIEAYEKTLELDPDHYEALINLGVLQKDQQAYSVSEACFRRALRSSPERVEAYANLSVLLYNREQLDAAENIVRLGIKSTPPCAKLHYNLGNILKAKGLYPNAIQAYSQAIQIDPKYIKAHWNKALAHLAIGDYLHGWREYEWRKLKDSWPTFYPYQHHTPVWRGEDIKNKTLLIHDEQGYGDTIQFSRFLLPARQCCARLIFETRRSLVPLFKHLAHIDRVVERPAKRCTDLLWDTHASLLSLPSILSNRKIMFQNHIPYLFPDKVRVEEYKSCLSKKKMNIGLVWAGNPEHKNDENRSIPFEIYQELMNLNGIQFHSLQLGASAKQADAFEKDSKIKVWGNYINSFADTAAILWNMDLLISVDTAVAHLCGALGKPLWLIVNNDKPDWRWASVSTDQHWYRNVSRIWFRKKDDFQKLSFRLVEMIKTRIAPIRDK